MNVLESIIKEECVKDSQNKTCAAESGKQFSKPKNFVKFFDTEKLTGQKLKSQLVTRCSGHDEQNI